VFQAGGQTMAIPADLSRPPIALGRSVNFIASVHPDRVWLLGLATGGPTVREVDLAGRTTSPPVALPIDWIPQGAVDNGLVLSNGLTFEVWDPVRARVVRPGPQYAQIQASNNRMVVWTSTFGCQQLCAIHLSDVVAGTDRAIYAQSGSVSAGAFSPDGRRLAIGLNPGGDVSSPGGLLMVDLSTYSTNLVNVTAAASSEFAWAPSGRWLFFLSAGNGPTLVEGYQLGTAAAQIVNLPSTINGSAFAAF
jgi:WD40-like Beta Propeller Repeat